MTSENSKYCANCGQATKSGGELCTACQNPIQDGEQVVNCPHCGSTYHDVCWQQHGCSASECVGMGQGDETISPSVVFNPVAPISTPEPDKANMAIQVDGAVAFYKKKGFWLVAIPMLLLIMGLAYLLQSGRLFGLQGNNIVAHVRMAPATPKSVIQSVPASVNNGKEGSFVAQQSDWIYYVNHNDGQKIYKMRKDGSGRIVLNQDRYSDFVVVGSWIYYVNNSDGNRIYKIRTDGGERIRLNNEASGDINIFGDWIYYVNYRDGNRIYKMRTDGSKRIRLNNDNSGDINIVGRWIYYIVYSGNLDNLKGSIYKISTDGNGRVCLIDDLAYEINVVDNWIYYVNMNNNYNIYKIRTDGSGRICLNYEESQYINVAGEWIYYSNGDDARCIYKMRTNGSERIRINEDRCCDINILGDWIYYLNFDDGHIYKIHTDGSGKSIIDVDEVAALKQQIIKDGSEYGGPIVFLDDEQWHNDSYDQELNGKTVVFIEDMSENNATILLGEYQSEVVNVRYKRTSPGVWVETAIDWE